MSQPVNTPEVEQYPYEAQSATGEAVRGTLEATSAAEASARLAALNLRVLSVSVPEEAPAAADSSVAAPPRRRWGRRRGAGVALEDFQMFNQQLAHLIAAGLPVERGLRLIAADLKSGRLSAAANDVAAELEKGVSLKDAFAHHASRFPSLYGRMVEAGVQAANLPAMLFNLGKHLELMSRLRRALWRAFAYPLAILLGLGAVLLFISLGIVPQFRNIYQDFHTMLPALTELMLSLGEVFPAILGGIAVLVALVLLLLIGFRTAGRLGVLVDYVGMRLPVIGGMLRASAVARWCDALRLGVEAGLDLPRAMALASEAAGSPRAARDSAALVRAIAAGRPAREARRTLLPATIPAAFEMAGQAGDLPATLATLSRMYEQQAEERLRMLPGVVTPLMMVLVGLFVAVTVLAMFLPLVKLIQSVSGGDAGGG